MNTLSIDIGNTRTKYDFWADDGLLGREEIPDAKALIDLIQRGSVEGVIVSSVNEDPAELISSLKTSTNCKIVNFNKEEIKKYGNLIQYKGNVGADRIAAYLGTQDLYKECPMLIVDMGTAMTLDIADVEGRYRGGNISLGYHSRLKALASSTKLLPLVNDCDHYISFGNDTISSIQSGAINGVMGEISFAAKRAQEEYDIRHTVMTGGDAKVFYHLMQNQIDCIYDPYLVSRGLNRHLRMFY